MKKDPAIVKQDGAAHRILPLADNSVAAVQGAFERLNLWDERVKLVEGWFQDTVPAIVSSGELQKIAVLRLDGDMYQSTMVVLEHFYPKLQKGGWVIIDDWVWHGARTASLDYRNRNGIHAPLRKVDYTGMYWVKE